MNDCVVKGFDFGALPITVTHIGKIDNKEWPHFLWSIAIKHKDGVFVTQYKTGTGLVEARKGMRIDPTLNKRCVEYERQYNAVMRPKVPTSADIMHSLLMDMSAEHSSFSNWCDEFGYDSDSIKALGIYQTCCDIAVQMHKCFTREQIAKMSAALEDY
jgi:hypothetical protein